MDVMSLQRKSFLKITTTSCISFDLLSRSPQIVENQHDLILIPNVIYGWNSRVGTVSKYLNET
ncbi:hypothetical protein V1477_010409 [Vespula maculifrons]|uniref:Uncharacterized protein n=1 Tax=Vespula maculifrons TaxID=7453 RepID=A0ABD2CAP2_VESMC